LGAIVPRTNTSPQRYNLEIWPVVSITVTGRYRINPTTAAAISETSTEYPLGGQEFGQVILESVLATAEVYMNDQSTIHRALYDTLLSDAIKRDSTLFSQEQAA
jgi:hypothetical protein